MPDTTTDPYPEHTKLAAIQDRSQAVGEFLEWLTSEQHYVLAEWGTDAPDDDRSAHRLYPVHRPIDSWLAQFFGVNPVKLEQEKRAMLDRQRELNDQHDKQRETA